MQSTTLGTGFYKDFYGGWNLLETETRNAICLAFLNACDSAVAPLDDLAQLAELDLNAQRRDR